jgi:hypothetical protein
MTERIHICAIAKQEGRYVREWVIFHRIVGVSHITIYDNSSTDDTVAVLAPFVADGFVDVIPWPMPVPSQLAAYSDCIARYHGQPIWVGFIDIDEFLWSPAHKNISEAIEHLINLVPRSAFGTNWMTFGNSGHEFYSSNPVIERFTWRLASGNPVNSHVKSLIWMDQDVLVGGDPHYFHVEHGTFNELGEPITGPLSPHHSTHLRINHYFTKSDEELLMKIARGRADIEQPRELAEFAGYQAQEFRDLDIQRYLPDLKQRLGL